MDFWNHPVTTSVVGSIIVAIIIAMIKYISQWLWRRKYVYLLGDWRGFYFSKDGKSVFEQKITISLNLLGALLVKIEEQTAANYIYQGKVKVVENSVFGYLKAKNHPGMSFFALKLPFNRRGRVPAMNGIFSGVSQKNQPASVKVHWSRNPVSSQDLKRELGTEKKYILVQNQAMANSKQNSVLLTNKTKTSAKKKR